MGLSETAANTVASEEVAGDPSDPNATLDAYEVDELDSYDLTLLLPTIVVRRNQHDEQEPTDFDSG